MAVYCWSGRQPRCIAFQFSDLGFENRDMRFKSYDMILQHQDEIGNRFGIGPGEFDKVLSRWATRYHECHPSL